MGRCRRKLFFVVAHGTKFRHSLDLGAQSEFKRTSFRIACEPVIICSESNFCLEICQFLFIVTTRAAIIYWRIFMVHFKAETCCVGK